MTTDQPPPSDFKNPIQHAIDFLNSFSSTTTRNIWLAILIVPALHLLVWMALIDHITNTPSPKDGNVEIATGTDKQRELIAANRYRPIDQTNFFPFGTVYRVRVEGENPFDRTKAATPRYQPFLIATNNVLLVYLATWAILLFATRVVSTSKIMLSSVGAKNFTQDPNNAIELQAYKDQSNTSKATLQENIINGRKISREANFRSNLLLVAGIVMAFMGIGIYFVTAPTAPTEYSGTGYWAAVLRQDIRPLAMLFFIEALAWFLLKQYKILTQEYKDHLDEANKKINFLVALQEFTEKQTPEERIFILANLLKSENSTILNQGQSTEKLEHQKLSDSNPVFDMANNIINKIYLKPQP